MKPSETLCQRLLPQSRFVDLSGFICNANFSFMRIRAAINVFAIPRRPICHHCAECMLVMMPKHPIIYAAFASDHRWHHNHLCFESGYFLQLHRSFRALKDSCPYSALRSCSDSRLAAFAAPCLPIYYFDFLFKFSSALHSTCCHHLTQNNHQNGVLIISVCPLAALSLWFDWSMDVTKAKMVGERYNL